MAGKYISRGQVEEDDMGRLTYVGYVGFEGGLDLSTYDDLTNFVMSRFEDGDTTEDLGAYENNIGTFVRAYIRCIATMEKNWLRWVKSTDKKVRKYTFRDRLVRRTRYAIKKAQIDRPDHDDSLGEGGWRRFINWKKNQRYSKESIKSIKYH